MTSRELREETGATRSEIASTDRVARYLEDCFYESMDCRSYLVDGVRYDTDEIDTELILVDPDGKQFCVDISVTVWPREQRPGPAPSPVVDVVGGA